VKHDYRDCLRPEYTIPGLIASLLNECKITVNKPDRIPMSVESICKVHAASKSTLVVSLDLAFEVSVPSFRYLQLSLAETLICHALVEQVDGRKDTEKMDQWLVESERMYEGIKEGHELIKRRGGGTWGSELDYLRVHIGRALVSHLANRLTEAHERW